mgnify:CR=1 FL=1
MTEPKKVIDCRVSIPSLTYAKFQGTCVREGIVTKNTARPNSAAGLLAAVRFWCDAKAPPKKSHKKRRPLDRL